MKTKIYLDYDTPFSYCPISLLPFLTKLLKRAVCTCYLKSLASHSLESSPNMAFTTILVKVTDDIHVARIKCQFTVLVLLGKFVVTEHLPSVKTLFTGLLEYYIPDFSLTSLVLSAQFLLISPISKYGGLQGSGFRPLVNYTHFLGDHIQTHGF